MSEGDPTRAQRYPYRALSPSLPHHSRRPLSVYAALHAKEEDDQAFFAPAARRRGSAGAARLAGNDFRRLPHVLGGKIFGEFLSTEDVLVLSSTCRLFRAWSDEGLRHHARVFAAAGAWPALRVWGPRCRRLERVRLEKISARLLESTVLLSWTLTSLVELDVRNALDVDDDALRAMAAACGATLRELRVGTASPRFEFCRVTDEGVISVLESCACLTSLTIENAPNLTSSLVPRLATRRRRGDVRGLERLELLRCSGLGALGSEPLSGSASETTTLETALEELDGSRVDSNLSVLDFSGCTLVDDAFLRSALVGVAQLRALRLSGCDRITDAGVASLCSRAPRRLDELALSGCVVTDLALIGLAKTFGSRLKRVDLSRCRNLTDAGVRDLLRAASASLETLSVQGCLLLTDAFALEMSRCGPMRLRELDLKGLTRLTDVGLSAVAKGCGGSLRVLSLASCENVGEAGLLALAARAARLERVDLFCCARAATDRSVSALCRRCPRLRSLDVSWCYRLSSKLIQRIQRGGDGWRASLHRFRVDGLHLEPESVAAGALALSPIRAPSRGLGTPDGSGPDGGGGASRGGAIKSSRCAAAGVTVGGCKAETSWRHSAPRVVFRRRSFSFEAGDAMAPLALGSGGAARAPSWVSTRARSSGAAASSSPSLGWTTSRGKRFGDDPRDLDRLRAFV